MGEQAGHPGDGVHEGRGTGDDVAEFTFNGTGAWYLNQVASDQAPANGPAAATVNDGIVNIAAVDSNGLIFYWYDGSQYVPEVVDVASNL